MRVQLRNSRHRFTWLALVLLLQRSPIIPWVKQAVGLLGPAVQQVWTWRIALPMATGAGTWHALTGATTFVTSNESDHASGNEGESFSFGFFTSGHKAFSYDVKGLPSGLSYNENINEPLISGTLPEAGFYEIIITGYRFSELTGNQTPPYSLFLEVEATGQSSPWNDTNTETLGENWKRSSWFGDFYDHGNGWVYHLDHGWLYIAGTDETALWIFDQNLGWLFTGKTYHPFFFRHSTSGWLYYRTENGQRDFWDYDKEDWATFSKN